MVKAIKYWKNIIILSIHVFIIERCNAKAPGLNWGPCINKISLVLDELLHSGDKRMEKLGERLLEVFPDVESYYVKAEWLKLQNKQL